MLPDTTVITTTRDGSRFYASASSYIERDLLVFAGFDWFIYESTARRAAHGDVYDVGANIGSLAIPWARAQKNRFDVIAFEPVPRLVHRLQENIKLNNLRNLHVIPNAVTDRSGVSTLYAPKESNRNQGTATLSPWPNREIIEVELVTLDELRRDRSSPVALIKIDVEGHDIAVMRGAQETISHDRPWVVFEYVERSWLLAGFSWELAHDLFSKYKLYRIDRRRRIALDGDTPEDGNILAIPCEH